MCAIGSPFIYNATAKVSSNWFNENERPFATMIGSCASILGIMIGFLFPIFFIGEFDEFAAYTPEQISEYRN